LLVIRLYRERVPTRQIRHGTPSRFVSRAAGCRRPSTTPKSACIVASWGYAAAAAGDTDLAMSAVHMLREEQSDLGRLADTCILLMDRHAERTSQGSVMRATQVLPTSEPVRATPAPGREIVSFMVRHCCGDDPDSLAGPRAAARSAGPVISHLLRRQTLRAFRPKARVGGDGGQELADEFGRLRASSDRVLRDILVLDTQDVVVPDAAEGVHE
jgi:hypothetical protein